MRRTFLLLAALATVTPLLHVRQANAEEHDASAEEPSGYSNFFVAGLDSYFGNAVGPAITIAGAHLFGNDIAFLVGLRAASYFPSGAPPVFRMGADIGCRAFFFRETVSIGIMVVAQPEMYPARQTYVGGGMSVAPVVEYRRLHIQIPVGISYSLTTEKLVGPAPSAGDLAHAGILAGINF